MKLVKGIGLPLLQQFLEERPEYRIYDYSSTTKFEECAARYRYVFEESLADLESRPALFSSCLIHPPLAFWYSHKGKPWNGRDWESAWALFTAKVGGIPATPRDALYTKDVAMQAVSAYTSRYTLDHSNYVFINTETVYWFVVPGVDNAVWVAKPDLVLARQDKELVTFDFKSSLYSFGMNLVDFDRQFLGQVYATGAKHMCKAFIQLPSAYNEGLRITRDVLPVDKQLLDEWLQDAQRLIKEIQGARSSKVWIKRAPEACTKYNRMCTFVDLCKLGKLRDSMFTTWKKATPFGYLENPNA